MSSDHKPIVATGDEMDVDEQSTSTRSGLARTWDGVRSRLPRIPQNTFDVKFAEEQPESVCITEGICAGMIVGAGAGALVHYQWKNALRTKLVGLVTMWIFGVCAFTACRAPKLVRLMREKEERERRVREASASNGRL